jgi:hypothetical protein
MGILPGFFADSSLRVIVDNAITHWFCPSISILSRPRSSMKTEKIPLWQPAIN